MLTTVAFCRSLNVLKSSIKLSNTSLETFIRVASAATQKWCARRFTSQAYTDVILDSDGRRSILLPEFPLISLEEIHFRQGDEWDEQDVDNFEFETDPTRSDGELLLASSASGFAFDYSYFPKGSRTVKVSYTAGFAEIPEDIQMGVALWVAHLFATGSKNQVKASETIGKYSYTNASGSTSSFNPQFASYPPDDARKFLAAYRKHSV